MVYSIKMRLLGIAWILLLGSQITGAQAQTNSPANYVDACIVQDQTAPLLYVWFFHDGSLQIRDRQENKNYFGKYERLFLGGEYFYYSGRIDSNAPYQPLPWSGTKTEAFFNNSSVNNSSVNNSSDRAILRISNNLLSGNFEMTCKFNQYIPSSGKPHCIPDPQRHRFCHVVE